MDQKLCGLLLVLAAGVSWLYRDALVECLRIDPAAPVLEHELSGYAHTTVEGVALIEDEILGALEMLCGTPSAPGYMLTQAWVEEAFDPNSPSIPAGEYGSGEITEGEQTAIEEGNRKRFARQLELLNDGSPEALSELSMPAWTPKLQEDWESTLALQLSGNYSADQSVWYESEGDFVADWRAYLTSWYPSLRDSAELYRRQCMHCHGVSGGGNGTTAPYLDPLPRDYRKGQFKFKAVDSGLRPRRQDLLKLLSDGAYGTAMPSFRRFSRAELNGLIDYVRLLSIRGEVEERLADYAADNYFTLDLESIVTTYNDVWDEWLKAGDPATDGFAYFDGVVPPATPESIARGAELFVNAEKTDCASCHGMLGMGNGEASYEEDPVTGEMRRTLDNWGNPSPPRNFTQGIVRAGSRPIDIYRRIYGGIGGVSMPAHPDYEAEDMWAIVHYVRSLLAESHRLGEGLQGHGSAAADDNSAGH